MTNPQTLAEQIRAMVIAEPLTAPRYQQALGYNEGVKAASALAAALEPDPTPALNDKERAAYIAGMRQAEKICRMAAQKVTNRVNWAHNCAAFIAISIGEVDDKTMLHFIKSGE